MAASAPLGTFAFHRRPRLGRVAAPSATLADPAAFPATASLRMLQDALASGMTEEPLFSIITPCLNRAHFLGEAIGSVLAQEHAGAPDPGSLPIESGLIQARLFYIRNTTYNLRI